MAEKIEFRVGDQYENQKGVYEVISLDSAKKTMVIRWENGEEIESSLELQEKIIRNMQFKKLSFEKQADAKPKYSLPKKHGTEFLGLKESDFKENVDGTTWRSRNCLGGAVSRLLHLKNHSFNSWAIYRMPEIQWADVDHREETHANIQAKFYAHISDTSLTYGFYIERSNKFDDPNHDWKTFTFWLELDKNEQWLNNICESNGLKISISEEDSNGILSENELEINKNVWLLKQEKKEITLLYSYLHELREDCWIELNIIKTLKKENVISKQTMISEDIANLFEVLMPLYEVSIKNRQ